jgi:hypothetical protein
MQDDVVEPVGDVVLVFGLVAAAGVGHAGHLLNDDPVCPVQLVQSDGKNAGCE